MAGQREPPTITDLLREDPSTELAANRTALSFERTAMSSAIVIAVLLLAVGILALVSVGLRSGPF